MAIKQQDKVVLIIKSGGVCGLCKQHLLSAGVQTDKPLGEYAHIQGDNPGSARYNSDLTDEEKNSHKNLFYLCPTCHTKIDKDEQTYSTKFLYAAKEAHEKDISNKLKQEVLSLSFYELEAALRHLLSISADAVAETLQVIPPKDKILKNHLSSNVESFLQVGLLQNAQIEEFLNKNADMDYSVKIRNYFVSKYKELYDEGKRGDDLFYALWNIANNSDPDSRHSAAALSVVSYYFYLCEVFER